MWIFLGSEVAFPSTSKSVFEERGRYVGYAEKEARDGEGTPQRLISPHLPTTLIRPVMFFVMCHVLLCTSCLCLFPAFYLTVFTHVLIVNSSFCPCMFPLPVVRSSTSVPPVLHLLLVFDQYSISYSLSQPPSSTVGARQFLFYGLLAFIMARLSFFVPAFACTFGSFFANPNT